MHLLGWKPLSHYLRPVCQDTDENVTLCIILRYQKFWQISIWGLKEEKRPAYLKCSSLLQQDSHSTNYKNYFEHRAQWSMGWSRTSLSWQSISRGTRGNVHNMLVVLMLWLTSVERLSSSHLSSARAAIGTRTTSYSEAKSSVIPLITSPLWIWLITLLLEKNKSESIDKQTDTDTRTVRARMEERLLAITTVSEPICGQKPRSNWRKEGPKWQGIPISILTGLW